MVIRERDKIVKPPRAFTNADLIANGLNESYDVIVWGKGDHHLSNTWYANRELNWLVSVLTHDYKGNSVNQRSDVNKMLVKFLLQRWTAWTWKPTNPNNPNVGRFIRFIMIDPNKARFRQKLTNALGRKAPEDVVVPEETLSTVRRMEAFINMVVDRVGRFEDGNSIRELADSAIANNNAAAAAAAAVRLAAPAPAPDEGNDDADNWDGLVPLFAGLGEDDETQDPEEPLAALDGGGGGNNEPDEAYDNNNFLAFDGSDEDGNDEAINRRNFAPTLIAPGSICRGIMVFGKYLMVLLIIFLLSAVLAFSSGMGLSFGWVYFELHNPFLTGPTARTGGTSTTDPLSPPYTTTPTPVASPVPVATTVATVEHHTGISDGPTLEGKNESNAIDFDLVAPPVDPTGDSTVATPPVVFSPSKTTPVASPVTVATVEPHTGIADGPTFQGKNESPAIDFDLLPPVNPIGDRTVANSPVAVVTDAIKSATNRTATHKDQTDIDDPILGTDMSPTIVGCMFLAPDTCIIDNFVCCECDDTEMGIKTGDGTDTVSVSEDEVTKEGAPRGKESESNDRESTSSFHFLYVGGVLVVILITLVMDDMKTSNGALSESGPIMLAFDSVFNINTDEQLPTAFWEYFAFDSVFNSTTDEQLPAAFWEYIFFDSDFNIIMDEQLPSALWEYLVFESYGRDNFIDACSPDEDNDEVSPLVVPQQPKDDVSSEHNLASVENTIAGTTTTTTTTNGADTTTAISDTAATMKTCTDKHGNKVAGTVDGVDYGACIGKSGNIKEDDARDEQEDSKSIDPQREGVQEDEPPVVTDNSALEPAASKRTFKTGRSDSRYLEPKKHYDLVTSLGGKFGEQDYKFEQVEDKFVEHNYAIAQNNEKNVELADKITRVERVVQQFEEVAIQRVIKETKEKEMEMKMEEEEEKKKKKEEEEEKKKKKNGPLRKICKFMNKIRNTLKKRN